MARLLAVKKNAKFSSAYYLFSCVYFDTDNMITNLVTASGFDKWGGDDSKQPYIVGGGLNGRYNLVGVHFHWGTHDNSGSEHTLLGLHYPLEVHSRCFVVHDTHFWIGKCVAEHRFGDVSL